MGKFNELATKVAQQYEKAKGYSPKRAMEAGKGVAAIVGRKKYGKKKFAKMAQAGKKK